MVKQYVVFFLEHWKDSQYDQRPSERTSRSSLKKQTANTEQNNRKSPSRRWRCDVAVIYQFYLFHDMLTQELHTHLTI